MHIEIASDLSAALGKLLNTRLMLTVVLAKCDLPVGPRLLGDRMHDHMFDPPQFAVMSADLKSPTSCLMDTGMAYEMLSLALRQPL